MRPALIDTDILSLFLRGHARVAAAFDRYLGEYERISISIISYYEILSGLKHRDAHRQLDAFLRFASESNVLPLTRRSCAVAADLCAQTRKSGKPIDDIDLLIAAIARTHDLALVTCNRRHFAPIPDLAIEDWSQT